MKLGINLQHDCQESLNHLEQFLLHQCDWDCQILSIGSYPWTKHQKHTKTHKHTKAFLLLIKAKSRWLHKLYSSVFKKFAVYFSNLLFPSGLIGSGEYCWDLLWFHATICFSSWILRRIGLFMPQETTRNPSRATWPAGFCRNITRHINRVFRLGDEVLGLFLLFLVSRAFPAHLQNTSSFFPLSEGVQWVHGFGRSLAVWKNQGPQHEMYPS